ncbi:MAG: S9 family peptidase [Candidatus Eremiobacteraeota bacterium]|nr:S9 family peptidase [Candidatus Eremiobacteraeota bacterium]
MPVSADLPPLIPRDVLFGNPLKTSPQISPDGKMLAYLAPSNGVLSVWVRTIGRNDDRVIATDPSRPIRDISWQGDSRHVLYLQDKGGNENFHIFAVSINGGDSRDLTPNPKVRAGIDDIDPAYPDTALIETNERDPHYFDVYRLDLVSGKAVLDTQNPGDVAGWTADNKMTIRAALVQNPDGSSLVRVRDSASAAPWRTLVTFSADDGFNAPLAFSPDGSALYVIDAKDANAARLVRYDVASGKATVVLADPNYDVTDAAIDAKTKELFAAAIERDRVNWTVLDPQYNADFDAVRRLHAGDLQITNMSADGKTWIVGYNNDSGPFSYYTYNRDSQQGSLLFYTRPALLNYQLAPMQPISYKARDGLEIHGYLTLPPGVAPKNLPTVLFVHGGPWGRDSWGYSAYVQWLANRGYAVLQANFRASTGYGKAFLNAGNKQWAGTMRTDLIDAKNWAVQQGYSDPKRFAIMGGSYGGYATLAAVTFTPTAFTCAVDIVGPSNLNTLLASIPPYWQTDRAQFSLRMGSDPAFLNSQSPLFKADQIKAPLLIGQGLNDPRVNHRESDQIVAAMRKNDIPVTYVVFPDEGHGFARPENNKRFNAETEAFLGKCLGGRVEPAAPDESISAFLK